MLTPSQEHSRNSLSDSIIEGIEPHVHTVKILFVFGHFFTLLTIVGNTK
jgi:hypothetical protein